MKKLISIFLVTFAMLSSCSSTEENVEVKIQFNHYWNDTPISSQDFNAFKFTTENGELISIERLRYLISNISYFGQKNYTLIDLATNSNNSISITDFPKGRTRLNFLFGFTDDDNIDGIYQDLNTANFNVPPMLGGGYHYMQFDGKYKDNNNQDANFNYHAIRAVDNSDPNNLIFEDTSFVIDIGAVDITNNAVIEIRVNIAEWFKNPNTWDLNQLSTVLMPNFNAQKIMSENGRTVFSLGEISQ